MTMELQEMLVDYDAIDSDLRPAKQMRVELDTEALGEYAEQLDELPLVSLVYDPALNRYWVADGAHRLLAAFGKWVNDGGMERGETAPPPVRALVRQGSYLDALILACQANTRHGVRLKKADREHRLDVVSKIPEVWNKSTRTIAKICNVSHDTVHRKKRELSESDTSRVQGSDGKLYPATRPAPTTAPVPEEPPEQQDDRVLEEMQGLLAEPDGEDTAPVHADGTATAATARADAPRDPAVIRKAMEGWQKIIKDYVILTSSFRRMGGLTFLIRDWPTKNREYFGAWIGGMCEFFQQLRAEQQELQRDEFQEMPETWTPAWAIDIAARAICERFRGEDLDTFRRALDECDEKMAAVRRAAGVPDDTA
jgi:hypothetical protein